ncbi:hypothetical protein Lal_00018891 [Lupinus albus]|nr:hypothetical protein Lal_00018891 [Lupinus albus]
MEHKGPTITDYGKCLRDANGNDNLKPPAKYENIIDEADRVEFDTHRTQDGKVLLEQSETHSPSCVINHDVLWVDARKNKQGVIDNEQVQEVVNRVVTLKERESFRTADCQPDRIRGTGFGVSKRTIPSREKRATKAVVADLQDKYDLLPQRFLEMERLMQSKFVEVPQASTTVNESFTHPRHFIPILEGIINNCKLFLDIHLPVGIGTMYNTRDAMIHNAQIPSNHLRVSIDISNEEDVLLPIPIDEDTITIGGALGTYVAWPVHLIDVVPTMATLGFGCHYRTSQQLFYYDSLKHDDPNKYTSMKELFTRALNIYQLQNIRTKSPSPTITWTRVKETCISTALVQDCAVEDIS